jgi:hypothetical protein
MTVPQSAHRVPRAIDGGGKQPLAQVGPIVRGGIAPLCAAGIDKK